jgi:5-methylcytosine-specific restriction protein A
MGMKDHFRHSKRVTSTRRWQSVRFAVLERDGWACVKCGERRRLEVDHIQPVRTHPELSFSLANLQCLCGRCHSQKTRIELGLGQIDPKREAWKKLVKDLQNPNEHSGENHA